MRIIDADALQAQIQQDRAIFTDSTYLPDKARRDELNNVIARIINAPTIEAEPVWKPASVRPERDGKYLVLWSLTEKDNLIYDIENYGTFEDWNDGMVEKIGWWKFDSEWGVSDCTEWVKYWMELPEPPKEEE